jgi:hypothetical protein
MVQYLLSRGGQKARVKVDKAMLQAHARTYLRQAAHLPDADVTFEGTADIFGYKFLAFSFHLPDWGDFWLVRGEQGYGVYSQSEYETIPEA